VLCINPRSGTEQADAPWTDGHGRAPRRVVHCLQIAAIIGAHFVERVVVEYGTFTVYEHCVLSVVDSRAFDEQLDAVCALSSVVLRDDLHSVNVPVVDG